MPPSSHLHPMPPDGLKPRSAPQAAPSISPAVLAETPPSQPEPLLHPARFGPVQLPPALRPTEPEPAPVPAEDDPFPDLLFCGEEDDDEDDIPDAVPSESMPVPACVPLYDLSVPPVRERKRKKG